MSLEPSSGLKQYFGSESSDVSVFNSAGVSNPAIDALIEHVISAENKAELKTSVKALDRALRSLRFWVPQWFNNTYRVAYWDMYEHPDEIPPFDLGYLDFGGTTQTKLSFEKYWSFKVIYGRIYYSPTLAGISNDFWEY